MARISFDLRTKATSKGKTTELTGPNARRYYDDKVNDLTKERLMDIGERALKEYFEGVHAAMAKRHSTPYAPGAQTPGLQRRSGDALKALTTHKMARHDSMIEGRMTLPSYLLMHEYGGLVKPKGGRYIAVPLPAALNPDGTPKEETVRGWHKSFVIKSRGGNVLIVKRGPRGNITPLYVLKPYVRIPATMGLRKTMGFEFRHMAHRIKRLIEEHDARGNAG